MSEEQATKVLDKQVIKLSKSVSKITGGNS